MNWDWICKMDNAGVWFNRAFRLYDIVVFDM